MTDELKQIRQMINSLPPAELRLVGKLIQMYDVAISKAWGDSADQTWEQADARLEGIARTFEQAGDQRVADKLRELWK